MSQVQLSRTSVRRICRAINLIISNVPNDFAITFTDISLIYRVDGILITRPSEIIIIGWLLTSQL
jgi:hypothetical protein